LTANVIAACAETARGPDTVRAVAEVPDTLRTDTSGKTDDCVRGEPEPVIRLGTASFQRTGKLDAIEDAQVDDTTRLRITHGGCAHYVESYVFTIRGAARDSADVGHWLQRAAAYVRTLDVGERRRSQMDEIAKAFEKAASASEPYRYGEPISVPELTTITCTVKRAPDGAVIEVIYDVAL
jgi:hypothetical protein